MTQLFGIAHRQGAKCPGDHMRVSMQEGKLTPVRLYRQETTEIRARRLGVHPFPA